MRLVVGVVTYQNSIQDLRRFAKAYVIAKETVQATYQPGHECQAIPGLVGNNLPETFRFPISVHLTYLDNGAPSELKTCVPDSVTELRSEGNIGYTRGINRLMKFAFEELSADVFITANPDGAFHHSTFKNFVFWHQTYPRALLEARQFPQEHPKVYDPISLDTPWCSGCCLFIPKLLYQSLGSFDEHFFMYMEDVDYSWRARAEGFQTKLCPDVLYGHHVVDRGRNEMSVHQHFISGRYLGWKWRHRRFFKWTEKVLLTKKGFTLETLPPLPDPSFRLPHNILGGLPFNYQRVTCFDKIFSFAERRW